MGWAREACERQVFGYLLGNMGFGLREKGDVKYDVMFTCID